jgi:hypothetical protein
MRHLIALLSICTFLTSSTLHAQVPSYVPTNGLVGWWPFNGNANDESGNGNDGVVNGATLTEDRFGNAASAYSFDGIDNNIVLGNIEYVNTGAPGEFSVSMWVAMNEFNSLENGSQSMIFGDEIAQNNGTLFQIHSEYGFGSYAAGTDGSYCNCFPELNTWVNYTIVQTSAGQNLYINGEPWGLLGEIQNSEVNNAIRLGLFTGCSGACSRPLNGSLDDIAIWNRALTPEEVQVLYTGQGSSPCVSPTAVSFTGLATSYTTSAGPVTLAGTPASGVFIGPGITGSTFSPAVAGEGTHSISYTYLDGDNCVNTSSLCTSVSLGMGLEPGGNAPGGVRVFPNPNRGQFTVELELNGLVGLQVFDARGALVHNEVFTASGGRTQRTLDLSAFAKGSYTLLVEHNGQRISQAVVVE